MADRGTSETVDEPLAYDSDTYNEESITEEKTSNEIVIETKDITNTNAKPKEDGVGVSAIEMHADKTLVLNETNIKEAKYEPSKTTILFVCEPCYGDNPSNAVPACYTCRECVELLCEACASVHKKQKATKTHSVDFHVSLNIRQLCELCQDTDQKDKMKKADFFCIDCDEVYCSDCGKVHHKQRVTKNHSLLKSIDAITNDIDVLAVVEPVDMPLENETTGNKSSDKIAESEDLNQQHETERHVMTDTGSAYKEKEGALLSTRDRNQPGKPSVAGKLLIDSVCLVWEPPEELYDDLQYQVRYKETSATSKWTFCPEVTSSCTIALNNLRSDSRYVFQVRMVNDEHEGPYSEVSDTVETIQSAAHLLMDFMYDVERQDAGMPLKKLPLQENLNARNETGKTRKLVIGNARKANATEKTILLIGATGTGKSTLVDGMINYILGVSWNDTYRLTLVDLEEEERNIGANQAVSQTQWITCYTINPLRGSRLDFTLHIIDTPGFGDTRGIERDKEIFEQIRTLFSRDDEAGVLFIDAICFLIKAPDARLTPTQMYIFNAIMSLFGQDIKDNFCMLVTFADGKKPPVLSALKEANLPHEQYFPFNNSGLFAENSGENLSSFSPMFWDMGCQSFRMFFNKLTHLTTKSLRQTRDVLEQRQIIEMTMENLLPKLDAGLNKVEELRLEIRILEDYKSVIEANSDFTYTVTETEQRQNNLPKGKHVTNCLNCHMTCHKDCRIPNDEDKKGCWAMNSDGFCTQCTDHCFWNIHRNTPYIFEYVSVQKQKTYTEKLEKYRHAKDEKMTREKVVERMHDEVYDLEDDILDLMERINECNNILRQIALRPDPLSVVEHIDLLIESERLEKRPGFQNRITSLQKCRKRATIGDDVNRFRTNFTNTTKIITAQVHLPPKPERARQRRGPFSFFKPIIDIFQKQ